MANTLDLLAALENVGWRRVGIDGGRVRLRFLRSIHEPSPYIHEIEIGQDGSWSITKQNDLNARSFPIGNDPIPQAVRLMREHGLTVDSAPGLTC